MPDGKTATSSASQPAQSKPPRLRGRDKRDGNAVLKTPAQAETPDSEKGNTVLTSYNVGDDVESFMQNTWINTAGLSLKSGKPEDVQEWVDKHEDEVRMVLQEAIDKMAEKGILRKAQPSPGQGAGGIIKNSPVLQSLPVSLPGGVESEPEPTPEPGNVGEYTRGEKAAIARWYADAARYYAEIGDFDKTVQSIQKMKEYSEDAGIDGEQGIENGSSPPVEEQYETPEVEATSQPITAEQMDAQFSEYLFDPESPGWIPPKRRTTVDDETIIDNIHLIIDEAAKYDLDIYQTAFVLATAHVESAMGGSMIETHEGGTQEEANDYFVKLYWKDEDVKNALGQWVKSDAYVYQGRGFAQITGRGAYTYYSNKYNPELLRNPNILLEDRKLAARILLDGMVNGIFKSIAPQWNETHTFYTEVFAGGGEKLSDYNFPEEFDKAREITSSDDAGPKVAEIAEGYVEMLRTMCHDGLMPEGINCGE